MNEIIVLTIFEIILLTVFSKNKERYLKIRGNCVSYKTGIKKKNKKKNTKNKTYQKPAEMKTTSMLHDYTCVQHVSM